MPSRENRPQVRDHSKRLGAPLSSRNCAVARSALHSVPRPPVSSRLQLVELEQRGRIARPPCLSSSE